MKNVTLIPCAMLALAGSLPAQDPSSIAFDGTDDRVNAGSSAVFDITDALTLEAWVKVDPTQPANFPRIIDKFSITEQEGYNLIVNSGHLFMEIFDLGGYSYSVYGSSIDDGTWHHVAGTFSGVEMRLYLDGVLDDSWTFGLAAIQTGSNELGIGNNYDGQNWLPLVGSIDEVRVWNIARTEAQILACMNSPLAGNEPGLVGYWRFDENGGTTAMDLTGNGNHAVLENGAAWSTDVQFAGTGDCSEVGIVSLEGSSALVVVSSAVAQGQPIGIQSGPAGPCAIDLVDQTGRTCARHRMTLPGAIATYGLDAGHYVLHVLMPDGRRASARVVVM